jgi:site-specific recombinase XerC
MRRFLEFFAITIDNPNTRAAYFHARQSFFAWCDRRDDIAELVDIEPMHVAAYIRGSAKDFEKPTVKQHLAAIRMLFDWLVTGQVVATNPAHSVRGPKHVVKTGKTTVLTGEQARELLDSIDTSTVVGLRDRALISVMTFAFARIGAAVAMRVEDYYPKGKRWWVRLHEKGGKRHEMPAHHNLEAYLDAYIKAAGVGDDGKAPLFRSAARRTDTLTDNAMKPCRCLAHDTAPRRGPRNAGPDRLSHVPGRRHHRLSRSRRHARKRASDGGARKPAHHQALRSHRR